MPLSHFFCTKTPANPAKRERRKEASPGELLEAALELFVEKGFAATRVEKVAARAGVSKGTLFLYFSSKEELLKAVVRENISGRFSEWQAELAAFEGSTADMLKHGLEAWCQRVGATRASGITKLMMSEAQNFPDIAIFYQHEVIEPGQALIRRILQRGMARGNFAPSTWTMPSTAYRAHDFSGLVAPLLGVSVFLSIGRSTRKNTLPRH